MEDTPCSTMMRGAISRERYVVAVEFRMQTEAEAFLQRIRAYPDDDTPRLIFADWLEEQRQSLPGASDRARFIRVQIALAQLAAADDMPDDTSRADAERSRKELLKGEAELLDGHREEWTAPFRGLANAPVFRRGFVEEVKIEARQFLRRAHELFALAPIRHLHLLDVGGCLPTILQSPYLSRLNALTIHGMHLGTPLALAVAQSPHLGGLKRLHLGRNRFSDDAAEYLAGSAILDNIQELDLWGNELGETGARALGASSHLRSLRVLEMRANRLGPAGALALAGSERLVALMRLGLAENEVGTPRLLSLDAATTFLRVPVLDLSTNSLTAAGLQVILPPSSRVTETHGVRIRELDLSHNELGSDGARVLSASPLLHELRSLRLVGCAIGNEGARALAESPHLNQLVALDLGNNPLDDTGLRPFLSTPHMRSLRRLIVPRSDASDALRHALHLHYDRRD